MVLVSKFSNFPDKLSKNDQLRGYELSRSDCNDNLEYLNIIMIVVYNYIELFRYE